MRDGADKVFYPAVELVRIWGAMAVVWIHYGTGKMLGMGYAVPCFVVISFFFAWKMIESAKADALRRRLLRLAIPFFAWGAVSYFAALATGSRSGLASLVWQLALGHDTCKPLYYLLDVAIITSSLFALRRLLPPRGFWIVVAMLSLFDVCVQYAGFNYRVFSKLPMQASYTLGRLVELFPIAVAGCGLGAIAIRGRLSFFVGMGLFACGAVATKCGALWVDMQFGYAGVTHILLSAGILAMATSWATDNEWLKSIRGISVASAGVYYIHPIVGGVLAHFGCKGYPVVFCTTAAIVFVGLRVPVLRRLLGK